MSLLGQAAVAMWWSIRPEKRSEFSDWHSHEHFPERMSIPGFRRGSRWTSTLDGEGFFVLYELAAFDTLVSAPYLERLNNPTPWSVEMMPLHRNMVRSQCRVLASAGSAVAGFAATLRLSPRPGQEAAMLEYWRKALPLLAGRRGLVGAHLLHTQTPKIAQTEEQKIRGGADGEADWIVLAMACELDTLHAIVAAEWTPGRLQVAGAGALLKPSLFRLAHSMIAADLPG